MPRTDGLAPLARYTIGEPGLAFDGVRASLTSGVRAPHDTVVDALDHPRLSLRAASVRGLVHRDAGTPRQDAFRVAEGDQTIVIAVADGVGSLPLSHVAAQCAVDAAVELVIAGGAHLQRADPVAWGALFDRISEIVRHEASTVHAGEAREAMATTLCCAVVDLEAQVVVTAGVGDSSCFLLRDGAWESLSGGKERASASGVVSNRTEVLPARVRTRVVVRETEVRPGDALVVASDGIGDAIGDGGSTSAATLAEWWRTAPAPLDFAAQVGFGRLSFTDDRTAVVGWLLGPDRA
ncbi:Serine/threonine protein phosphatase PrpC [Rathayibacter oskolensis]|uniref:Serine/threonine protein phosphatase PrpC n=1 Tax=Rathayibacter oskolensis TaxID=1891671 RepID=A0A1X7N746_9MICO|nr:protein phosphatase 2C domain-containing protein [Rathayibacter oskolensis]SMH32613.1 Serine/threonine protein phosphatase PrpC [Rathayibacter oskolensis]